MRRTSAIGGALLAAALGAAAAGPEAGDPRMSAEDIRACAGANAPDTTMVQQLRIESVDRAGGTRRIVAMLFYKRFGPQETRATLQVRAPLDISGTSYLMVDKAGRDRLMLYLPSLERVRRVTGGGAAESMLGTDFSYEDMKQIRSMSEGGELARLADASVAGRPVYRVALTPPAGDDSAYRRIVFGIDRKTCVPLRITFFGPGDEAVKRYAADPGSLHRVGQRWLARKVSMRDLRDGTRTRLTVESVRFDEDVSGAIFNSRTFYLGAYQSSLPAPPGGA